MNWRIVLLLAAVPLFFTSCYYADGPITSLRGKKARLAQKWRYTSVRHNNFDITDQFTDREIEFTKDNSISWHSVVVGVEDKDSVYLSSGRWEFGANNFAKLDLFFIDSTDMSTSQQEWEIKKLTKKELWLYSKSSSVLQYFLESVEE